MDATANVTGSLIAATPTNWLWVVALYIVAVAVLAFIPRFVDMFKAYKHQRFLAELLITKTSEQIEKATANKADADKQKDAVKALLAEILKQPEGMPGIARLTIAFSIIMIVAVALFHLIVFGNVSVSVISSIISSLIAIIGTIAGFYFGAKQVETKKTDNSTTESPDRKKQ
jgi:Flp pilus assembly protein TadB